MAKGDIKKEGKGKQKLTTKEKQEKKKEKAKKIESSLSRLEILFAQNL